MDEELVIWDDKAFSVGFPPIDLQHKKIVEMLNDLITGCKYGDDEEAKDSFLQIAERAIDYAKIHFAHEEKFFSRTAYPNIAAHKKEHYNFLFELVNTLNEVESNNTTPMGMVRFLKNWLLNHIGKYDKDFAAYASFF